MRLTPILLLLVFLTGCTLSPAPAPQPAPRAQPVAVGPVAPRARARDFVAVVQRVEPVAEAFCRERGQVANCDFLIVVDDNPNAPPNAFQTVNDAGRPVLAFTLALIAQVRNQDELAFVMAHEASHHVLGHLARSRRNATAGAIILGGLAQAAGANASAVQQALRVGAAVGARSYSKDFELEADGLGAVIAHRAGYDPVRGAAFFQTISDPGNRFLGTHPPNAARMAHVRQIAARL